MQQQLPEQIESDFTEKFNAVLYKQYISDPSGLKLLIEMLQSMRDKSSYKNSPSYLEGMQQGLLHDFTNNLESNLPWVASFIVDYLDEHKIPSGYYKSFRKIALDKTMSLLREKL